MIKHEPYGIDDPYKANAFERFPRDPLPGQPVQVRFGAPPGTERAWADVCSDGKTIRIEATPLSDDTWTVDIGKFGPGAKVVYDLGGEGTTLSAARGFGFEVGTWVEVMGVASVDDLDGTVRLWLDTRPRETAAGGSAPSSFLDLSSPTEGVLRAELGIGESWKPNLGGGLSSSREGSVIKLTAPGLHAEVDLENLTLDVNSPGVSEPQLLASLLFDWLAYSGGGIGQVRSRFKTEPGEWIYGLGERFTEANRNGRAWDVRVYEEYKEQGKRTYLPVPFIVSQRGYGVWLDAVEPSRFDLTDAEAVISLERLVEASGPRDGTQAKTVTTEADRRPAGEAPAPVMSLCLMVARDPYAVTAAFTRLTGEITVPPKWAFAPWMSSNSWNTQQLAEAAIKRTVAEDVPAGVIVIEAWSDESTFYIFNDASYDAKSGAEPLRLSDFTFGGRWPDPKAFIDLCHEHGIRVVLWQIPVLKRLDEVHAQHDADERHMLTKGFAIANADGTPYRNKGWWFPGALIIDFTSAEARKWWFSKRRYLFDDLGIDGMKTDGGEHLWGRDLRAHDGRRGIELFNQYANLYVGSYHEFVQEMTGGDGVTFSRAGYTGAQRFPGHWAGDEDSSWDAYRASIRAGLAAGVSGVSMWSWDIAGFSGEIPTVELYLRSTAMSVFSPLMQYHSEGHGATEVRDRTPWNIAERQRDSRALELYRRYAQLRMRIVDLIHEDARELSAKGLPMMRYPPLEHAEEHDFLSQDPYAYFFGRDLFVAPVVDKGVLAREVRLPPGQWLDAWSGARFAGPRSLQANADLDRIPVFVRANSPRAGRWLEAIVPGSAS